MKRSDLLAHFIFLSLAGCANGGEDSAFAQSGLTAQDSITTQPECPIAGYCFQVTDPAPLDDMACPPDRQIGYRVEGCASPSGWTANPLFPGGTGELAKFCLYTWNHALPAMTGALPSGTQADCNVIAPQGHPYEDLNAPQLEAAFLTQIGHKSPLPRVMAMPAPTKVVIIDSAVTQGFPNPGTGILDHGEIMGLIVRKIACPIPGAANSACLGIVSSQLGLALRNVNGNVQRTPNTGGKFGNFSDISRAIFQGYQNAFNAAGQQNRIILNMSFGWDPHYGGSYPNNDLTMLGARVRAVHSAIRFVRCRGALPIAAAGNSSGGANFELGASYPGGWEAKSADDANCAQFNLNPLGLSNSPYRPLVYAVSAVDGIDNPLSNARPGGRPPLVAPGAHVTFAAEDTRTLTGSSVATAVASGIAATVWGYQPGLEPDDVMFRVKEEAYPLPDVPPEFCLGVCPSSVLRLSQCEAAKYACEHSPYCPLPTPQNPGPAISCPDMPGGRDARPANLDFDSTPVDTTLAAPTSEFMFIANPCNATIYAEPTGVPEDPCSEDQYHSRYSAPWILSQPEGIGCPVCQLNHNAMLKLGLSPDLAFTTLKNPTLTVEFSDAEDKVYPFKASSSQLLAGETVDVGPFAIDMSKVTGASVQFTVDDKFVSSDPILVEPPPL